MSNLPQDTNPAGRRSASRRARARRATRSAGQRLALARDLPEGATLKFRFVRNGRPAEGFLARFRGKLVAYENRCRHLPVSLDLADGRFFTPDGRHFVCQTHGALYEPRTGRCVHGPCLGARLKPLPIVVVRGAIWLRA